MSNLEVGAPKERPDGSHRNSGKRHFPPQLPLSNELQLAAVKERWPQRLADPSAGGAHALGLLYKWQSSGKADKRPWRKPRASVLAMRA